MKIKLMHIALAIFLIANTALQVSAKIDANEKNFTERWNGKMPTIVYINGSIDTLPSVKASYLEKWEGKVSNFGPFNENLLKYMPVNNMERLYMRHRMIEEERTRNMMISFIPIIVMWLIIYFRMK